MESELRLRAEELVRKHVNDCINPEAINEAITAITVDLYNLYWDTVLFGGSSGETTWNSKSEGNTKRRNSTRKILNQETEGPIWIDRVRQEAVRIQRIQKSLEIVCNGTDDHNHLLCPVKDITLEG